MGSGRIPIPLVCRQDRLFAGFKTSLVELDAATGTIKNSWKELPSQPDELNLVNENLVVNMADYIGLFNIEYWVKSLIQFTPGLGHSKPITIP